MSRHEFQTYKVEDVLQILGSGAIITGTTHASAGTEAAFAHGLARVPRGYIVYSRDKAASIYDGTTANTSTYLYLKSSANSTTFTAYVF